MHALDTLILDLALILVVAGITTILFHKIRQPLVLGYILAGFLTGPAISWLPTVSDPASITVWGNLGIIFIMFALGLEFSFHKIASLGASAVVIAMTVIVAMLFTGYAVGQLLGWSYMDSIFLGGMISISSTTIILKAYQDLKLRDKKYTDLVLGALIIEDIAAIFMMIILSTMAIGNASSGAGFINQIGQLVLYLILWLILGIYLIPEALKRIKIHLNDETLLIVSLGLCLLMVAIADYIGFSSALGAFIAGSILAGTIHGEHIEHLVEPIKNLFGAVFFVSVGMLVSPEMLVDYAVPILIITIVTIIGQMLFSSLGSILSGQSLHTTVGVGMSMVQIGEFSLIIAALGSSLAVTGDFLYPVIVCVSVITIFLTPIFIKCTEPFYKKLDEIIPDSLWVFLKKYTSEKQQQTASKDWQEYLKWYFPRTLLVSSSLFAGYAATFGFLPSILVNYLDENIVNILIGVALIITMLPLINILTAKKSIRYRRLWAKHRGNRLPLLFFRGIHISIAITFLTLVLQEFILLPWFLISIISLGVVLFIRRSDFFISASISMELRFMENLNEKILSKSKKQRGIHTKYDWLDTKLKVSELYVSDMNCSNGKNLFFSRKFSHINVIEIIRSKEVFPMPKAEIEVLPKDRVYALGTDHDIDSYIFMLQNTHGITITENKRAPLRSFISAQTFNGAHINKQVMCFAVLATKDSGLVKKTIKSLGFTDKYKATIVGIERRDYPIISPDKNLVLNEGDLLWVVGTQYTTHELMKAGLLQ